MNGVPRHLVPPQLNNTAEGEIRRGTIIIEIKKITNNKIIIIRYLVIRRMHDYVKLDCFRTKPRFQRVIPLGIASVNSQSSVNQMNCHVKHVTALTRWKIIMQKRASVVKSWTLM